MLLSAGLAGIGSAGAAAAPRLSLAGTPKSADVASTVAVSGRMVGRQLGGALFAHLEGRVGRGWRNLAQARVAAGRFKLRWVTPNAAGPLTLRIEITGPRKRRIAVSKTWRLAVLTPGSGVFQRPPTVVTAPPGSPASPAPPGTPTPTVPTPPQTTYTAPALTLPAGTEEALMLPEGVEVDSVEPVAGLTATAVEGAIHLAAAADSSPAHRDLTLAARGCVEEQCGLDLTVHAAVDVTPFGAPSGSLTTFPQPAPDRLAAAQPLADGLPGKRLMDELVVTLGTDAAPGTRADAEALAAANGAVVTGGVEELGIFSLGWETPGDLGARRAQLASEPGVSAVDYRELETVGAYALPPGDWNDDGQEVTWPFTQIHAQQAWDYQAGGLVKVGIVDEGRVQPNHEDLNVVTQLGPQKWGAHATHVAGLACARANGIGVVGVAWGCPLVTSSIAGGSDEDVLGAATAVALQPGVKVVNISLGPNLSTERCATPAEHQARMLRGEEHAAWFRRLFSGVGKEIVWTIAAGNNCENGAPSPMAQNADLANVIVVGATNSDGSLASFSSYGQNVEVAAPGGVDVEPPRNGTVGLWSTWMYWPVAAGMPECGPAFHYCWAYGTSMAAPMVAGIADLIRSAFPGYSADDVGRCIVRTASGAASRSVYPVSFTPQIPFEPADAVPIVDAAAALQCKPGEFDLTIGDGQQVEGGLREPLVATLHAAGGRGPYAWALETGYSGPIDGLSLTSGGVLSGTPTYAGSISIPVTVTDAEGNVGHGSIPVKIAYGPAPPISGQVTRLTNGNGDSTVEGISEDGSTVLISSRATNLTADPPRTEEGSDLFTIDTATKQIHRITKGTGETDWGMISADGSTVVFRSTATDLTPGVDPNGSGWDLYAWKRSSGAITRIGPGDDDLDGISSDGSKALFTTTEGGSPAFWVVNTTTGVATRVPTEPGLEYTWNAALSADGNEVLYTATPDGTNYVPFVHLRNLSTGVDRNLGVQTLGTLLFADDDSVVVYGTYQGFFNEGTAIYNLASGQVTVLDGGVNGVFNARAARSGDCIVLHSWENTALTSDLPNRGEKVYYDDLFSYDMGTHEYTRLTNTYDVDTGFAGVATSDNCAAVAFDVPPGAVDPERQDAYSPTDVYLRRP
jgi:Tol biopolymer transport system component